MDDPKLKKCIEEVQNGQLESFGYVIEKYQTLALNIALPIVKNQEDAEEIVQDAFVKVYRFIQQYNGESRFSSWLYKIVYNTALTKLNTNTKQWMRDNEIKSTNEKEKVTDKIDERTLDRQIRSRMLDEALDQLPESDKLLVTLYYLAEKSIAEIAEITAWNPSKCKVKLMRARRKMREILQYRKDDLL